MSYEHYRNLMPLPYPNAAGSDASACAAVALDLPPSGAAADFIPSSDGGGESRPTERQVDDGLHLAGREKLQRSDERPLLGHHQVGALVQIGPQSPKSASASVAPGPSEPTHAETIAQLEALLQGYRDFDDAGRDITDATLVYADPPPIYLRQARA